jgi:hypothetical protein
VVKQQVITTYRQRYQLRTLVETGTFRGAMVEAQRTAFERIYSIELSDALHAAAVRRFRGDAHITILHGDSGRVLQDLVPQLRAPALFWLDGHYSGGETALGERGSPIIQELQTILQSPTLGHVIIVDDARLFTGQGGYPTINEVSDLVLPYKYTITIDRDSLQFEPKEG